MNRPSTDRRSFLKLGGVATVVTTATGALALRMADNQPTTTNNRSNRSESTSRSKSTNRDRIDSLTAASRRELHDALSRASAGDTVSITDDIAAGTETFLLPDGVTLAGDRGTGGSAGPTLSTDAEHYGMIEAGANSRVTGLRFDGPNYEFVAGSASYPAGSAIETVGSGVEVDNCEIFGFSWAGIDVRHDSRVHHNYIHHCNRDGLGYGVLVANGSHPLVEYNYFDYNRHSIAGNDHDDEGTGYEVRFNVFGPEQASHTVDMHEPGGKSFEVHHNTIMSTEELGTDGEGNVGVVVRGIPSDVYEIHHNWFHHTVRPTSAYSHSAQAIAQRNHYGEGEDSDEFVNVEFWANHYGPDEPAANVGAPNPASVGIGGGAHEKRG